MNDVLRETFLSLKETKDCVAFLLNLPDFAKMSEVEKIQWGVEGMAARFGELAKHGTLPVIESYLSEYQKVFQEAGIPTDAGKLLPLLIQWELEFTRLPVSLESMVIRFPEQESFLKECFEGRATWFPSASAIPMTFSFEEAVRLSNGDTEKIQEVYSVQSYLSRGGQKDVYEVVQESTGQHLAWKELRPRLAQSPEFREAFLREVRLQSRITHQSVPVVFSLGTSDGTEQGTSFLERYITGTSWASVLKKRTLAQNLETLLSVARVLACAHREHGILHGDLKPQNVMMDEKYQEIYLVDWGMALALNEPLPEGFVFDSGTLAFMPPEVAKGVTAENLTFGIDVFMLGAILYQILTGVAPYEKEFLSMDAGPLAARKKAQRCDFEPLPEFSPFLNRNIPIELRKIAECAMACEPERRYADATEFANALEKFHSREQLVERCDMAGRNFAQLKSKIDTLVGDAKKSRELPQLGIELIGVLSEITLVRKSLFVLEIPEDKTYSASFWDVLELEVNVRNSLLEYQLLFQDYGLAPAQLESLQEIFEIYIRDSGKILPRDENGTIHPLFQHQTTQMEQYRRALERGLAAQKRQKWFKVALAVAVVALLASLTEMFLSVQEARHRAELLAEFEESVFPYALVAGYVDNFFAKLIPALDEKEKDAILIVALPQTEEELRAGNKVRSECYVEAMKPLGYILEDCEKKQEFGRPVTWQRFTRPDGKGVNFDLATTTSGFLYAVDYKKGYAGYESVPENEMVIRYSERFADQMREHCKAQIRALSKPEDAEKRAYYENLEKKLQDGRIQFVRSPEELVLFVKKEVP